MNKGSAIDLGSILWIEMVVDFGHTSAVALPAPSDAPSDVVYHCDGPSGMNIFVKTAFEDAFGT